MQQVLQKGEAAEEQAGFPQFAWPPANLSFWALAGEIFSHTSLSFWVLAGDSQLSFVQLNNAHLH